MARKKLQLVKLTLQLIPVKKTDNLQTGGQVVFKDIKQDRQVELLFTVQSCNYSNKSVQHQQPGHSTNT